MMQAIRQALRGFGSHQGFFLAAGLSFYAMICVVPLLFLVVSLTGFILSQESASRSAIAQVARVVPVYQRELTELLSQLVGTRHISGLLGSIILFLFSTQLFTSIRLVLNRILEVERRGFWRGMLFDGLMILLISVFFFVTVGMTTFYGWFRALLPWSIPSWFFDWSAIAVAFLFSVGMFFLLYRFVPNQWVSTRAALTGALTASLLWEAAKHLFRAYILTAGVYDKIYGPLGILVAMVMFTYYSGLVFIFGAELTRVVQDNR